MKPWHLLTISLLPRAHGCQGTAAEQSRALGWDHPGLWPQLPSPPSSAPARALTGDSPSPAHEHRSTHQHIHIGKSHWHLDCSGKVWLKPKTGPFLTHSFGLNAVFAPQIYIYFSFLWAPQVSFWPTGISCFWLWGQSHLALFDFLLP